MSVVASGTVTVRCLDTGRECSVPNGGQKSHAEATPPREWDEMVEVFERDLQDTDGSTLTVENAARRVAKNQACPATVETWEADLS